jgi:hypothetical protein
MALTSALFDPFIFSQELRAVTSRITEFWGGRLADESIKRAEAATTQMVRGWLVSYLYFEKGALAPPLMLICGCDALVRRRKKRSLTDDSVRSTWHQPRTRSPMSSTH